jgi:hypothetical protein
VVKIDISLKAEQSRVRLLGGFEAGMTREKQRSQALQGEAKPGQFEVRSSVGLGRWLE